MNRPESVAKPVARQARGLERRDLLVEAALRASAEHGLSALTLQDVADAAGVAKSVVLYYCDDRAGLLNLLAERAVAPWKPAWAVLAEATGDPREVLNRWLSTWFALVDAERPAWRVQLALLTQPHGAPGRKQVEASDRHGQRGLTQLLQRGHDQYAWHAPDAARSATLVRSLVDGMCLEAQRNSVPDGAMRLHGVCRGAVLDLLVRR